MSHKVVTGWGLGMVRLTSWLHEARLQQKGLTLSGTATVTAWRHQMGSRARRWSQVEAEAQQLIAVHTMARLLETCYLVNGAAQEAL